MKQEQDQKNETRTQIGTQTTGTQIIEQNMNLRQITKVKNIK